MDGMSVGGQVENSPDLDITGSRQFGSRIIIGQAEERFLAEASCLDRKAERLPQSSELVDIFIQREIACAYRVLRFERGDHTKHRSVGGTLREIADRHALQRIQRVRVGSAGTRHDSNLHQRARVWPEKVLVEIRIVVAHWERSWRITVQNQLRTYGHPGKVDDHIGALGGRQQQVVAHHHPRFIQEYWMRSARVSHREWQESAFRSDLNESWTRLVQVGALARGVREVEL